MIHSERPKIRMIPAIKGTLGLFICPDGKLVQVRQSHIDTVILQPAQFETTTQEIESIFAKHNELMGIEGSARQEILCGLVMKGWIRLRRYIKPREQWSVTVKELDDRTRLFLHNRARNMLTGELGFREDDLHKSVVITELASGTIHWSSISKVASPNSLNSRLSQPK
jgi:hypothetical protein